MTLITVWPLKRKVFAIIEWPHRQLWDADERRRGMLGQLLALQSKMCSLSLSLPPPLSGFLPVSLCELWVGERLYPRRSAGGNTNKHHRLLPLCGSVLCWRDGFVPSQRVCQLCSLVCVSIYLGCTEALTERTLNKCHPMYRTPQLSSFLITFLQVIANTCGFSCMRLCELTLHLLTDGFARLWVLANFTSSYRGTPSCLHKKKVLIM